YSGPTPAALPAFNYVYTGFSGKTDVIQAAILGWSIGTSFNDFQVVATANYQNGSTSLTFPDLSSVTGFLAPPAQGTTVAWTAVIAQGNSGMLQPATSNSTRIAAVNAGTYPEP
ncbi:MAG TPA: hypothetical protein VLT57_00190, partial [Bryobacteraceae bacterium]|nr:hypothetical protein [Bryobacteraceae bacterium]